MRLNNKKKIPTYNFFNTLLLIMLSAGIIGYILNEMRFNILDDKSIFLIIIPVFLLVLFHLHGKQVFEYDSDGEALHFRNRSIVPVLFRSLSDEFPKYKLIKFEVVKMLFFKRLYVTVSSKNTGFTLLKYDISYLTSKEINDLKLSLNKVIKANKEKDIKNN